MASDGPAAFSLIEVRNRRFLDHERWRNERAQDSLEIAISQLHNRNAQVNLESILSFAEYWLNCWRAVVLPLLSFWPPEKAELLMKLRKIALPFAIASAAIFIAVIYAIASYSSTGWDVERVTNAFSCRASVFLQKAKGDKKEFSWREIVAFTTLPNGFTCITGRSFRVLGDIQRRSR